TDVSQANSLRLSQVQAGTALRRQAEEIDRENAALTLENPQSLSLEETRQTLHELRVHQIELEMQCNELRLAQVEINVTRARYFDLYNMAPVGLCTLSEKGRILEANLTAATLLGLAQAELVNQQLSRFIFNEDQDLYYLHRKHLFDTGKPQASDLRMVKNDGTAFWAHLESTEAQNADGIPVWRFVMSDITNRKLAEAVLQRTHDELERQTEALRKSDKALRASLEEKDVLLKEVHHRVKNNLAAIMGLIDLQGQKIVDEPTRAAMTELSNRIRSMSLVHEQLYRSENFARIDFQDYLNVLTAHLHSSYHRSGNIHVSVAADGVTMGLDSAVPCGLLITELVTNAFKYAFPAGRLCSGAVGCEIVVSVEWDGAAYTLTVSDNGVGLPAGLDWTKTKTMGLLLVKMLGQHQLQGKIEVDYTGGTRFRLRFVPKIACIYE
ncbi:MAG: histidine kinase dimerization/phosphoacceptor domain -containing protein, partial [Deltaproteobacteria bacterium]